MRRAADCGRAGCRSGSSFLEVQVAFAALGVALAGLAPVVVTQLRLMARIEARLPDGVTLHLVPADDPWARKLGAAATVSATDPGPPAGAPAPTPKNRVQIEEAAVVGPADVASVVVLVEGPEEAENPEESPPDPEP